MTEMQPETWNEAREIFYRCYDLPALHLREDGFHQGDATDSELRALEERLSDELGIPADEVLDELGEMWESFLNDENDMVLCLYSQPKLRYRIEHAVNIVDKPNWEIPFVATWRHMDLVCKQIEEIGKLWQAGEDIEEIKEIYDEYTFK